MTEFILALLIIWFVIGCLGGGAASAADEVRGRGPGCSILLLVIACVLAVAAVLTVSSWVPLFGIQ